MAVCCLCYWPPRLLCSRGMPVCARGWDAGPSEGRSSGGMFCASTGDVGRGQTRLQDEGGDWGIWSRGTERVEKFCGHSTWSSGRRALWLGRGCLLRPLGHSDSCWEEGHDRIHRRNGQGEEAAAGFWSSLRDDWGWENKRMFNFLQHFLFFIFCILRMMYFCL